MNLPQEQSIPAPDPNCDKVKNVDTTIAKFKAAVFRVGFNLWDIFKDIDEDKTHFISESKFLSVIMGPLKNVIGLGTSEIAELTNYLKKADGRIAYTQLCKLVHETECPHANTEDEKNREYSLASNNLTPCEEDGVLELLTKIAIAVSPRNMLIKPFFQDFELIRRGSGQVSRNTFKRVLSFIGFCPTTDEFELLFKKYRYDAFTIKYNAFLKDLEEVRQWLKKYEYIDVSGTLRPEKVGKVGTLPRPELSPAPRGSEHGIRKVWSDPEWRGSHLALEAASALNKIREHVRRERLRVEDYFRLYDESDSGRVPRVIFEKCVNEWVCVSEACFNNLFVSREELRLLVKVYIDTSCKDKVLWKVFMDDLEWDVDPAELSAWERRGPVRTPANPFISLYRPPSPPVSQEATLPESLEHVRASMETRPDSRRLLTALAKKDGTGTGYIDPKMFDWSFVESGIYLNANEKARLHEKYQNEWGVSWRDFVQDLQAHEESISEASKRKEMEHAKMESQEHDRILAEMAENNIIQVLGKIKKQLVCKRVWIMDFLKEFDKNRKQLISRDEFQRGLSNCGLSLTKKEMDTLLDVFSLPSDPSLVEYQRFCRNVDEESLPPCLVRPPLKDAMAREERKERLEPPRHRFANYSERQRTACAVDKLIKHVSLANTDFFKSIDAKGTGTMRKLEFQKSLQKMGCLHLLTNEELDTIMLSFGVREGLDLGLDYMAFLNAVDIVSKTKKAAKSQ